MNLQNSRIMKTQRQASAMTAAEAHNTPYFYTRLLAALERVSSFHPYKTSVLGKIGAFDFYFCAPARPDPQKKNLLIAGGIHGEEPAGSWGIVAFLETATAEEISAANISFLPLVNPTGFNVNRRHNDWDEDPNQGYDGSGKPPLPREGALMIQHLDALKAASTHGLLSLHEDTDMKEGYLWSYEPQNTAGPFTKGMLQVLEDSFGLYHGKVEHRGSYIPMPEGYGLNVMDNSFESLLLKNGTPYCATTETPAHADVPLARRMDCCERLVRKFIDLLK